MPANAARTSIPHLARRPSRWLGPVLVLLALLSTQLHVQIPSAASLNGTQRLDIAEVLFVVLGAVLATRLFIFGDYRRLDDQARYLLRTYALLIVVWLGLTVGRRVLTGNWVISVTLVEYLGFALAWYLVFRLGWLSKRSMLLGALGLMTVTNAWGLAMVLLAGSRVRASGLLSNINVYVGTVLLLLPLLLHWSTRTPSKPLRWLIYANAAASVALVLTSGSRFALVGLPLILLATTIVIAKSGGWGKLRDLGVLASLSLVVGLVMVLINPSILGDLTRATSFEESAPADQTVGASPSTSPTRSATPGSSTASSPAAGAGASRSPSASPSPATTATSGSSKTPAPSTPSGRASSPAAGPVAPSPTPRPRPPESQIDIGDPDYDLPKNQTRDLTHGRILARSIAVLENHWLWGTGRPVIFFSGWGYHPPHNLFLEVLTFVGIFGSIPYLMIALLIPVAAIRRLGIRVLRSTYLWGVAGLFCYSMLQPLITDQLVLLMLVWGFFGALMGPGEASWKGVTEL